METMSAWKKNLVLIIITAVLYIVAARLGLMLAVPPGYATAVWAPSGIAVGLLLICGLQLWPGVFIGSFIANMLVHQEFSQTDLIVSMGIAIGSSIQAVTAAYLMESVYHWNNLMKSYRHVIAFFFITVFSCVIAASFGVFTLHIQGLAAYADVPQNWLTWWLGDITGILLYTPFMIAWLRPIDKAILASRFFERLQLTAATAGVALLCFGGVMERAYPLSFLVVPCLLWAVFRFGSQGTTAVLVGIAIIAAWGTAHGLGVYGQHPFNEALLLVQTFIGIVTVATLILLAVVSETRHTHKILASYKAGLQVVVAHRTGELQQTTHRLEAQIGDLKEEAELLKNKIEQLQVRHHALEMELELQSVNRRRWEDKQSSLGMLMMETGRQMVFSMNQVIDFSRLSLHLLSELQQAVNADRLKNPEARNQIMGDLESLATLAVEMHETGVGAHKIVDEFLLAISKEQL